MLILASSSPQRRAILGRLGVAFTVVEPEVDELSAGDPAQVAEQNALRKAHAVASSLPVDAERSAGEGRVTVLAADTVVAVGPELYGKPADEAAARAMLHALGGRAHVVFGGLAVLCGGERRTAVARTEVRFRTLGPGMIDWYLATGEWRSRAGAYAIQGAGAALVRELRGDYENVVGLPLAALLDLCPGLLAAQERAPEA